MPRIGKATTLYLWHESYQEFRRLIKPKSVSQEINDYIPRRLAELEQQDPSSIISEEVYADLKRQHTRLLNDAEEIRKKLRKQEIYDQLMQLVKNFGLDFETLGNIGEVAPKLLSEWQGSAAPAHQFVTLMETVRELKKVEQKLTEIRNQTRNQIRNQKSTD